MATPSKQRARGSGKPIPITIENVGGIQRADLILLPGVNELVGANGAGKTSAMLAIRRAHGEKVPIEKRDGASEGTIEAPGVVVRIRSVAKTTGEAELEIADAGPVSRIIDPGMKGSDEAAAARIKALIELLRPSFDAATIATLAGDREIAEAVGQEYREGAVATLDEAAERVRLVTHRLARAAEAKAAEAAGAASAAELHAAEALERAGGEEGLEQPPVEQAERAAIDARERLGQAKADRARRVALEAQQAEARGALAEAPDPLRFDQDIELRQRAVDAQQLRIDELSALLAKEREAQAAIKADLVALKRAKEQALAAGEQQLRLRQILAQPIEGPDEEELERFEAAAVAAEETARAARLAAEVRHLATQAALARQAHALADDRAKSLRELGRTVYDRLADLPEIAERAGRLTILAGRLHVRDGDGDLHDYELRRSDGQRIDAALEVAAEVYGHGSVVALEDRYWLSLDDQHRAEFARLAARHGLYVVTARPTEGALSVHNLGATAQGATA